MINFYRRYIPNCAEIVAPITELTKNKMPNVVKWGDKQEKAFTKIKECLSTRLQALYKPPVVFVMLLFISTYSPTFLQATYH